MRDKIPRNAVSAIGSTVLVATVIVVLFASGAVRPALFVLIIALLVGSYFLALSYGRDRLP